MTDKNLSAERAFQIHLAEYGAVRDEINLQINLQHQLVNYGIALIAGTVTVSSIGDPSIASQFPAIFLVASLLMSAVSWALLETSFQINNLGNYIHTNLAPKIQKLIGEEKSSEYMVLKWEDAKVRKSGRLIFHGIAATGKFAITLISSVVFAAVFLYTRPVAIWTSSEAVLFWITIVVIFVFPIGGLINLPFIIRSNLGRKKNK